PLLRAGDDDQLTAQAAEALGQIGTKTKEVTRALKGALEKVSAHGREAALRSLVRFGRDGMTLADCIKLMDGTDIVLARLAGNVATERINALTADDVADFKTALSSKNARFCVAAI